MRYRNQHYLLDVRDDDSEDTEEYNGLVFKHQSALTGESMHAKIDIAKELAFRDHLILMLINNPSPSRRLKDEVYSLIGEST